MTPAVFWAMWGGHWSRCKHSKCDVPAVCYSANQPGNLWCYWHGMIEQGGGRWCRDIAE